MRDELTLLSSKASLGLMTRQKYQNFEPMTQMTPVYGPPSVKLTGIEESLSPIRAFYSFNQEPIEQSGLITVLTP